jgi:hypothetical protein
MHVYLQEGTQLAATYTTLCRCISSPAVMKSDPENLQRLIIITDYYIGCYVALLFAHYSEEQGSSVDKPIVTSAKLWATNNRIRLVAAAADDELD